MNTAERLSKVAEGLEKTQELNTELESIINGGDTGYKSHYHKFWDKHQKNGTRGNYSYAFGADSADDNGWDDELFKPKYDIIATGASYMFRYSKITNLKQILIDCGVKFIPNTTMFYYTFHASTITHIPDLSSTEVKNCQNAFNGCANLVSIDKLKVIETCVFDAAFIGCTSLENLIIEGVIGTGSFNVRYSPKLSKASITSIINALSTTTSGLTVTLSKTAKEAAFTTDEWNTLIATKSNWTISLV